MKKFFLYCFLLLLIVGCKNTFDSVNKKTESKKISILIDSNIERSVAYPKTDNLIIQGYSIIANGVTKYKGPKSDKYEIEIEASANKIQFEIIGYSEKDANGNFITPVVYCLDEKIVETGTTSLSFTTRLITQVYTSGALNGVSQNGKVRLSIKMPDVLDSNYIVTVNSRYLDISNKFSKSCDSFPLQYTFKSGESSSHKFSVENLPLGKHTAVINVYEEDSDDEKFIYVRDYYVANNVVTNFDIDLSGEDFDSDSCTELALIRLYEAGTTTNLLTEDGGIYKANGIHTDRTYHLELTMKVEAQNFIISSKLYGELNPSEIIFESSKISTEFIDSSVSYAQKVTFEIPGNKIISLAGDSILSITVEKGSSASNYSILISQNELIEPEDVEVSHPVDVSAMTALPVPVTELTETNYVITNEAQLFELGTYVNDGGETTGKTFVLGENIALTSEWVPIGYDTDYPFMGIFDGNNYKISNLSITTHNVTHGFIGSMESGTILNLTVEGSINVSSDYVAGICAYVSGNSKINNCINNVIINGGEYCGGISAYYYGDSFEITNCVNFGSVIGHEYCSGIIGRICAGGTSIINCVNLADVTSDYSAAGIALTLYSTIIENSYNAGIISGTSCESPVSYGMADATLKDCYYLKDCTYESGELFVRNALGSATNSDAEDVSSFTHSSGDGNCTLTKTVNSKTDLLQALNSYSGIELVYNEWVYSQNSSYKGLPVFKDTMARLNQVAVGGSCHKPIDATWKNITEYFSGDTVSVMPQSGETVVVSDVVELSKVNKFLASSNLDGVTIILSDDINFADKPSGFNNIYGAQKFSGTFDGNNYKIYNYSFSIPSSSVGFIAKLDNGTVCNLAIEGTSLSGSNYCGAITGETSGIMTKIDNCIVNINVENASSSYYGGIVGYIGSGTTTIRNCINFGNVYAKERVGGLIGQIGNSATAVIENCANYGTISQVNSTYYFGGLVGYLGGTLSITNSFNYGQIESTNGDPLCGYKAAAGSITSASNCFYNSLYSSSSNIGNAISFLATGATLEEIRFIYNISDDLKNVLNIWVRDNTVVNQTYNKWDYKTMNLNGVDTRVLVFK